MMEDIAGTHAEQEGRLGKLEREMDEAALQSREFEADHRFREFEEDARKTIEECRSKAQTAHERFVNGKQGLLRADGMPIYSEAVHAEHLEEIEKRRSASFEEIGSGVQDLTGRIEKRLEAVSQPPRLTDQETQRANVRKDFIREDVDHAQVEEIPEILRMVELTGDRAEVWCAVRYAKMRADRELARLQEAASDGVDDPRSARISQAVHTIREKVQVLEDSLRLPGEKKRRETLERLRSEALAADSHVLERSITDEEREARSVSIF